MKSTHINRAHNTQSCLLIIFQYQPIRFQYSWLSIEQPIRYWLLQKLPWKFVTHMMIIPILTCPINNGPINLSLWSCRLSSDSSDSLIAVGVVSPFCCNIQQDTIGRMLIKGVSIVRWFTVERELSACGWSVMLACCIKCVKVGWSMLVTFSTFLITLSAPATKSLQNLSVGGCEFCHSEYFIQLR